MADSHSLPPAASTVRHYTESGPGLTTAGATVRYERLVNPAILELTRRGAERISFIFGRGGEEIQRLDEN